MKLAKIENVQTGMILSEDVYGPKNNLLLKRGTVLNKDDIQLLIENFIFYVHVTSRWPTLRYPIRVSTKFELPRPSPVISNQLKNRAISSIEKIFETFKVSKSGFHNSITSNVIKEIDTAIDYLVEAVTRDSTTLISINGLKSYDEYTYHHSLSVAVLSISIGQYLMFSKDRLAKLAKSAIMHDIGKQETPLEIIHKPSKLSPEEYKIIQCHPEDGFNFLLKSVEVNQETLSGVMSHHEKMDGTGYPHGLKNYEIPEFARIISVADVYDALTSVRPYRKPNEPAEAVEYIMGSVDTSFDFDIVDAFIKKIDLYPIGSFVRLSTKQTAIVVDNQNQFRPIVRMLDTGDYADLFNNRKYINVTIKSLLPDGAVIIE